MPSSTRLLAAFLSLSTMVSLSLSQTTSTVPTDIVSATPPTASPTIPTCAQPCLAQATSSLPCAAADAACLCLHASSVESSVQQCLSSSNACTAADLTSATAYYPSLCLVLSYPTSEKSPPTLPLVTASGSPTTKPSSQPASSSPTKSPAKSSPPLSVPAIAGIASAAAFLLFALLVILVFLYTRRRSRTDIVIVDDIENVHTRRPGRMASVRTSVLFTIENPDRCGRTPSLAPTLTNNEFEDDGVTPSGETAKKGNMDGEGKDDGASLSTYRNRRRSSVSTSVSTISYSIPTPPDADGEGEEDYFNYKTTNYPIFLQNIKPTTTSADEKPLPAPPRPRPQLQTSQNPGPHPDLSRDLNVALNLRVPEPVRVRGGGVAVSRDTEERSLSMEKFDFELVLGARGGEIGQPGLRESFVRGLDLGFSKEKDVI